MLSIFSGKWLCSFLSKTASTIWNTEKFAFGQPIWKAIPSHYPKCFYLDNSVLGIYFLQSYSEFIYFYKWPLLTLSDILIFFALKYKLCMQYYAALDLRLLMNWKSVFDMIMQSSVIVLKLVCNSTILSDWYTS